MKLAMSNSLSNVLSDIPDSHANSSFIVPKEPLQDIQIPCSHHKEQN